jgi:NAD(P)-dependent dehydrogenase (short-subunit alcohol dehydrogenase family)
MSKLLLVTGVSTGFGRALSEAALAKGYRVVGTVRSEAATKEFGALKPGQAFGRVLDVTDTAAIAPLVAEIEQAVGPIEVLVNNAGYGFEGILEESTLDEIRHQFEVNVFGAVAMMQAVLPGMRKRRSGRILNITSMGGGDAGPDRSRESADAPAAGLGCPAAGARKARLPQIGIRCLGEGDAVDRRRRGLAAPLRPAQDLRCASSPNQVLQLEEPGEGAGILVDIDTHAFERFQSEAGVAGLRRHRPDPRPGMLDGVVSHSHLHESPEATV